MKLWSLEQIFDKFNNKDTKIPESVKQLLCYGIALNTDATPVKIGSKFEQIGNKTECALLELAFNLGYDF